MIKRTAFWLLILTLLLSACQQNTGQNTTEPKGEDVETNEQETETDQQEPITVEEDSLMDRLKPAEELPSSYQQLLDREPGVLSGIEFVAHEEEALALAVENLPKIETEDVTEEELDLYFLNLLSYVQESYTGPDSLLQALRFQAYGDPSMDDSRFTFKEQLNVEILLDGSGSMAEQVNGRTRMDLAKEAIDKFVKDLPSNANVGLRVYGHKGSGSQADKSLSCSSNELLYPIQKYNEKDFNDSLSKIQPAGWTPLASAVEEAAKDMASFDAEKNTNIVFLVSDGIETCGGDPVKAVKDLADSNVSPIVNIIGFGVDGPGQKQLKQMAKASEGIYTDVKDQSELAKEFNKVSELAEKWEEWKKKGNQELDFQRVKNNLDIFSYTVNEEVKRIRETTQIFQILTKLWLDKKHLSQEAYNYLREKNTSYHEWIKQEQDAIKEDLKSLNNANFLDAKKEIEERYQTNINQ